MSYIYIYVCMYVYICVCIYILLKYFLWWFFTGYWNSSLCYVLGPCCLSILSIMIFYHFTFSGRALQSVGSWFPSQGLNPCCLNWKCRALTTGQPGKSQSWSYSTFIQNPDKGCPSILPFSKECPSVQPMSHSGFSLCADVHLLGCWGEASVALNTGFVWSKIIHWWWTVSAIYRYLGEKRSLIWF